MRRLLLFFLPALLACQVLCAQNWFLYKKDGVKKWFERSGKKNGDNWIIQETDSSLTALLQDSVFGISNTYFFNEDGRVEKVTTTANCDSCFRKYVKYELNNKSMGWRQLNDTFYISGFSKKTVLEVHPLSYSFSVIRVPWTAKQYAALLPRPREKSVGEWMKEIE